MHWYSSCVARTLNCDPIGTVRVLAMNSYPKEFCTGQGESGSTFFPYFDLSVPQCSSFGVRLAAILEVQQPCV